MRLVTGSVLGGSWQPRRAPFSATAVARRGLFRGGGQTHDELESKFVVATQSCFLHSRSFWNFLGSAFVIKGQGGRFHEKISLHSQSGPVAFQPGQPCPGSEQKSLVTSGSPGKQCRSNPGKGESSHFDGGCGTECRQGRKSQKWPAETGYP